MSLLILGLVLFLGMHSLVIVAPGVRDQAIARIGTGGWKAIHGVASLVGLILIAYGFGTARLEPPVLYSPPDWLRLVAVILMLPVFPLLFAAYLPGRIQRAAKHPMLAAVKIWALAHLLANGLLADVLLFGGFLTWAVADRISLKRRAPTLAVSAKSGRWNDVIAVGLGLGAYALTLSWAHLRVFGVSPLG
jgi:uncharacterized membrane protein